MGMKQARLITVGISANFRAADQRTALVVSYYFSFGQIPNGYGRNSDCRVRHYDVWMSSDLYDAFDGYANSTITMWKLRDGDIF